MSQIDLGDQFSVQRGRLNILVGQVGSYNHLMSKISTNLCIDSNCTDGVLVQDTNPVEHLPAVIVGIDQLAIQARPTYITLGQPLIQGADTAGSSTGTASKNIFAVDVDSLDLDLVSITVLCICDKIFNVGHVHDVELSVVGFLRCGKRTDGQQAEYHAKRQQKS